jgi:hypothetical protein
VNTTVTAPPETQASAPDFSHHRPTAAHNNHSDGVAQAGNASIDSILAPSVITVPQFNLLFPTDQNVTLPTMSLQDQPHTVRSDFSATRTAEHSAASRSATITIESRTAGGETTTEHVVGSNESPMNSSSSDAGTGFEHIDYVGATKPNLSAELAIGYAVAVFQAAQLATKGLAHIGSNLIHSPGMHAAHFDHEKDPENAE